MKKKVCVMVLAAAAVLVLVFLWRRGTGGGPVDYAEGNVGDSGMVYAESSPDFDGTVYTEDSQPSSDPAVSESWSYDEESVAYEYSIPQWTGEPWVVIGDNVPDFTDEEKKSKEAFEEYSPLDEYGRCGVAYANICRELMPTEKRGSISEVHPTGWKQAYYPELIVSENLYSRAHLIAFQLAGENANKQNLITGTMYFNGYAMLDFEEEVGDYVRAEDAHVLYRITPDFWGDELVARGIRMEAWSVEDAGKSICFDVYVYNVQPGITIDYSTGASHVDDAYADSLNIGAEEPMDYVLNTSSMKFHLTDCNALGDIKPSNKEAYFGFRSHLLKLGYVPCRSCDP